MSKFIAEKCIESFNKSGKTIKASKLYDVYRQHCLKTNIQTITSTAFGRLATSILTKKHTANGNVYTAGPTTPAPVKPAKPKPAPVEVEVPTKPAKNDEDDEDFFNNEANLQSKRGDGSESKRERVPYPGYGKIEPWHEITHPYPKAKDDVFYGLIPDKVQDILRKISQGK